MNQYPSPYCTMAEVFPSLHMKLDFKCQRHVLTISLLIIRKQMGSLKPDTWWS